MIHNAMCDQQHIRIKPDPKGLSIARSWISRMIDNMCFKDEEACGLLIAIGEAVSNAYLHGTPDRESCTIGLSWNLSTEALTITIEDAGGCNESPATQLCDRGMLARGAELIRSGVDGVIFSDHHISPVVLIKRLPQTEK